MTAMKLDPRETHWWIDSPSPGLRLFLRHMPPAADAPAAGVVLYVHGGTFPSALSIAHRFDGRSWRDELCAAGFHVWALDFHGFGRLSDPYPAMAESAEAHPPLGRAAEASRQLEAAVRFVRARHEVPAVSIIAHSWGTIVSGAFAGRRPDWIDRMVFFGPIARRDPGAAQPALPGWRPITLQAQWERFTADVPAGAAPVLDRRHFAEWGEAYLDCDPDSRTRVPPAVQTPSGAFQDIFDAWEGRLAYDPGLVRAPVLIVRGEWDGMCTDADARWLFDALANAPMRRDVKISRATHLMHLEESRYALYREAETFLKARDIAPAEREEAPCSP